jgi:hypothetical protein
MPQALTGRVKFLPLAWAGMPKTSFRKNGGSLSFPETRHSETSSGKPFIMPFTDVILFHL